MIMELFHTILAIVALILSSAVVSSAEISLASSRKLKLQSLANEGDVRALQVLKLQEHPGRFITVVQILLNMVAILGGGIGESALSPYIADILNRSFEGSWIEPTASTIAFILVTCLFILFADLIPKRIAITYPEVVALRVVGIMNFSMYVFKPLVWLFDTLANAFFRLFRISTVREDGMTSEDIFAVVEAGAEAGVLKTQEHYLIENIFDMQARTVTSTMTTRENIVYLDRTFSRQEVMDTLSRNSHSKIVICDNGLDKILGYIESHTLLTMYLQNENVVLTDPKLLRKALFVPDTLSLYEVLELFKSTGEDFAIIVNEYALVVGIVTLNDVMSIVMGELVSNEEEYIVSRDENSWLIDGATPLEEVTRVLDIAYFPDEENYETISGFMMYMLRKIPKKTDSVVYGKYKFEVIDTENFKIDQILVSLVKEQE
ncbi:hemolysin family protein [Haemophilus influenzae]|uniref:hemolysin family protein n=1 Tax=Haemophilus TaxID=724 RepID=UPI00067F9D2F|nr:hemolysin family protein [Haemophilus influenzae]KMZ25929.1 membrane protein [Haemophilus influenzae]MCK8807013.1 hemolysin family protein [Haemophilus influenzae]MCK8881704.1 hemolysin family protein [Haemophilus influenzae]MCK9068185.1 hemolysin family protein [Haemophilus influenzae]MCK9152916.1 hemolysin family protein [Haemophilus influenzae]